MSWREVWSTAGGRIAILLAAGYTAMALVGVGYLIYAGRGEALDKIAVLGGPTEYLATLSNPKREASPKSSRYFVDVEWVDETGAPQRQPSTRISADFYRHIAGSGQLTVADATVRVGNVGGRPRAVLAQDARRVFDQANDESMPVFFIATCLGLAIGGFLTLVLLKPSLKPNP